MGELNINDIDIEIDIDLDKKKSTVKKLDITKECKKEIGENLKRIREYEQKFRDRMKVEADAGFFFSVVFRSREEKEKFIAIHDLSLEGNNYIFIEDFEKILRDKDNEKLV